MLHACMMTFYQWHAVLNSEWRSEWCHRNTLTTAKTSNGNFSSISIGALTSLSSKGASFHEVTHFTTINVRTIACSVTLHLLNLNSNQINSTISTVLHIVTAEKGQKVKSPLSSGWPCRWLCTRSAGTSWCWWWTPWICHRWGWRFWRRAQQSDKYSMENREGCSWKCYMLMY